MANEKPTGYDSGHVVVPVYHPGEGAVHNIAFPSDETPEQIHSTLLQNEYEHPSFSSPQPDASGVLENDPRFKAAAGQAWNSAGNGALNMEGGFIVGRTGGTMALPAAHGHSLQIPEFPGSPANVHTHENYRQSDPSEEDKDIAKRTHRTVYVVSRNGLYDVDPSGKVTQPYTNTSDIWDKNKKAKEK